MDSGKGESGAIAEDWTETMGYLISRTKEMAVQFTRLFFLSIISILFLNSASAVQWSRVSQTPEDWRARGEAMMPSPIVREMLVRVDKDRALGSLRQLDGESEICLDSGCHTISDRQTSSEGLRRAMDYLHENLAALGYSVESRDWSASGRTDRNLRARKPGVVTPSEEVYLVAHVDGKPGIPAADDDGSGVVDLLELARILKDYSFERTIVLLFATGEEDGNLGVTEYFNALSPEELDRIKYAVNVDMVGFDGNADRGMELWDGGDPSSILLTQMMSDTIRAYQLNLVPRLITGCG